MTGISTAVDDIDELSVIQVAHDGMRLHLTGPERDDIIAWRLYTTPRTVQRVAARFGLTDPALNLVA
jgi:hypothetical protein